MTAQSQAGELARDPSTVEQAAPSAHPCADPLLALQRAAVKRFHAAGATRAAAEAGVAATHAAALLQAEEATGERRSHAAQTLERAHQAALALVSDAREDKDAELKEEVHTAVQRAHEARDRVLPAMERVGIGWIRETERVKVPAAPDAGARLLDAVARTEAAVQPVLDAIREVEAWKRTRATSLRVAAVAAVLVVGGWWAVDRFTQDPSPVGTALPVSISPAPAAADPVASGATVLPEPVTPRITLQYQAREDRGEVSELYRALLQRPDWQVGSPEHVLPDAVNRAEVYGGVRYFFEEDSVLARNICNVVREDLARRGYAVTFPLWPMITLQRQGHFHARRGLIEVWISPLPQPTLGGDPAQMGQCGR